MAYQPYHPSKVYVEKRIVNHPVTERILIKLSHLSPIIFNDLSELGMDNFSYELQCNAREKPLVLAFQKSDFLKQCPGTRNYLNTLARE